MIDIADLPVREIAGGIGGKYIHGTGITFGYVTITEGSILPAHSHIHEQVTYIIEGELEMKVGNELVILRAGSVQVIPSNVTHSAIAKKPCIVIDVFTPSRDDYR